MTGKRAGLGEKAPWGKEVWRPASGRAGHAHAGRDSMPRHVRDDPTRATVAELADALRAASSLRRARRAVLDRIARRDPELHAFITVYRDDARLAAEAADRASRSGHGIGPLHGIPIALKDLVDLEGRVTIGGSQARAGRISPGTATLARQVVEAGMIVLGKTHTVEFAMGGYGTNAQLGTPWNPWDLRVHRTPGGSSSGSGVAVAAALAPIAIGTDTGGSVRLPAACCGIVGLKVTVGRISTHGVLPFSATLDTPGPMTRSVEDAALLFRVLQRPDPHDPRTRLEPPVDPIPSLRRGVAGSASASCRTPSAPGSTPRSSRPTTARSTRSRVSAPGSSEVRLPGTLQDYVEGTGRIIAPEAYHVFGPLAEDPRFRSTRHVRARVLQGRDVLAHDYLEALRRQAEDQRAYAAATADLDALLTPTTRTPAIPLTEVDEAITPALLHAHGELPRPRRARAAEGLTRGGLPTSLQIVGPALAEATALRIGWAYEQATEWDMRSAPPEA